MFLRPAVAGFVAVLLASALPKENFIIEEPGGHTWKTWTRLTKSLFSRIQTAEADAL